MNSPVGNEVLPLCTGVSHSYEKVPTIVAFETVFEERSEIGKEAVTWDNKRGSEDLMIQLVVCLIYGIPGFQSGSTLPGA